MTGNKNIICCFTGHRDIITADMPIITAKLNTLLEHLLMQGIYKFRVGGAIGFDTLAAQCIIDLKSQHSRLELVEVLPFSNYRSRWTLADRVMGEFIDSHADSIIYACEKASRYAYLSRDRLMVDGSNLCISYCNRSSGGTAYTVKYALKNGLYVYNIGSLDISSL